jgi:hypothetical protein
MDRTFTNVSKRCEKLSEEFDVIALTCLGTGRNQKEKRISNLTECYGDVFSDVACIEVRESKEHYLKQLVKDRNVVGFVDDRLSHLQEGINVGIKPLLYVRNTENPKVEIKIVNCWSKVENEIKLIKKEQNDIKKLSKIKLNP